MSVFRVKPVQKRTDEALEWADHGSSSGSSRRPPISSASSRAHFTAETGKQWTQALGSIYALFEIAKSALVAVDDPHDRKAVAHALRTLKYEGMCGPLDFTSGPQPGIALQKIVGGQWRKGKRFPWDVYIVHNGEYPAVPLTGDLEPTYG